MKRIDDLAPGKCEELLRRHAENDSFGNPRKYRVFGDVEVSCTTIRYISVLLELKDLYEFDDTTRVAEIGVGYGGQAALLNRHFGVSDYTMFDLVPVQSLTAQYLKGIGSRLSPKFARLDELQSCKWDFVISNYAFSELPIRVQREYLRKVLKNSSSGYLIMNSGRTNMTGRSAGKISLQEILREIPDVKVSEEIPQSGPDNYVISW